MNVYEIAFSSYIYRHLTGFNKSFNRFMESVGNNLDLNKEKNRQALLNWLNAWGCRNFYTKCHELASSELADWYSRHGKELPQHDKNICELSANDLRNIQKIYNSLKARTASKTKNRSGSARINSFGNTSASKILFAIRPRAFIPWDIEMRKFYKKEYGITTYEEYLKKVIIELKELRKSCIKNGFRLEDLPIKLNKETSTLPKLIDEYHWVTITRKFNLPDSKMLKAWLKWNT